ncbi:acetyl-CoA carboxylase, carboxyltransferase subunit beta [Maricaulis salignorans]|uniref:Acetyl-coenzyme A carboxylase carboxyl transferase subunit beta n=1 Tax=Maricaulis salignorans TaxID=144026 RepID=A0A1G9SUB5_9PROT|nr:acetyl-CoA carboxylase, carboxyltransferase subunit beta [Maricaulis salignorans]SDM38445.1 acetyl-CoA carboxylase carboxyltransferase subunit alpha [Maricaulis salignorans]
MNWLSKITPPGMSKIFSKRDTPDNLWVKCPISGEMVFQKDLEAGQFVTPAGHHMRIGPAWRFQFTFDDAFEELDTPEVPKDPLKFRDEKTYVSKIAAARKKTGRDDAMAIAVGRIGGVESVVLVQNFAFMGGSLGMAAGESFIKAAETAIAKRAPLIVFTAAGGARMQEGALSLMQMPRTTIAVEMLRDASLPYVVVLTDPTTGGVTASYAMLGDVQIAEPGALIGFAGPRVIEQTIREKLPEGFQRAEYLLEKGMIDQVVHRHEIPATLARMLRVLMKRPSASTPGRLAPPSPDHVAADGGSHEHPTPGH